MGLNAQNIQNYEFNLGRITDIAKLHNATSATLDTFGATTAKKSLLVCLPRQYMFWKMVTFVKASFSWNAYDSR